MADRRKSVLIELGAETLADALLEFASGHKEINDRINWLLSSQEEKLKMIQSKIAGLHEIQDFIDWRHSREFERILTGILYEIKSLKPSPETGLLLVADFIRTDAHIIEICEDDSTGDIYTFNAAELFVEFAKQCKQKDFVINLLQDLLKDDEFGVRESILKKTEKLLSKPQ